jgi:hypothetical protein
LRRAEAPTAISHGSRTIVGRNQIFYGRMSRRLIRDDALARSVARLHARGWRALIRDDMGSFAMMRNTLIEAFQPCSMTLDHLALVDGEIIIELLDVVISRYNRSHRTSSAYFLALMDLAGRLGRRARPLGRLKRIKIWVCRICCDLPTCHY